MSVLWSRQPAETTISQGPWSYSANNQLIGYDAVVYEYDANGNTVKKTENGQAISYTYNARNRLERGYLPDGRVATYAYDPFGRRVKKQVGNSVTYFAYADEGLVGEYDATGSLQVAYGWKPDGLWGTDPLYRYAAGSYAFYHNDHLGTPQRLTATNGSVVWAAAYAAFGLAVVDPASTVENNLRFPGQYWDNEISIHYNFRRYYDPETGRYLSLDPIRDQLNWYLYAEGNPVINMDPYGLFRFGKRPLGDGEAPWIPGVSENPLLDYANAEFSHEQGFFEDAEGGNIGFAPGGIFTEDPKGKGYVYDYRHYDDSLMREAVKNVRNGHYSLLGVGVGEPRVKNNCQDWGERLRDEYERLRQLHHPDWPKYTIIIPFAPSNPMDVAP